MDQRHWHDEPALTGRSAAPTPAQQRHTAVLALWRLRAPVFAFGWDPDWGIDPALVDSLFRSAVSAPGEQSNGRYAQAVAELSHAPLLTSEVDGPNVRELVQLETFARLLAFGETLKDPAPDEIGFVVDCPRELAHYVDQLVADSFYDHPSEAAHRQYLTSLPEPVRSHGLGYLASRNLTVERLCHGALDTLPTTAGLLETAAGRNLIAHCEDFGAELVTTLKWLETTGH